jgi:polyphosphate kinase
LHYPYQSFHHVIDLLREAAIDPKVTSIKITLYRVAKHSNIVNALINAIRNGKKVSVLLELKARFDEEANIYWTQKLEEEGAHLIEGVPGLKIHSKLCLITRKEKKKEVRYASIGTGNFNESTAKIYSDHALLTADKAITNEVEKVFEFLENNYRTFIYKHLVVSPFYMRKRFARLIKNETKNAKAGKKAYIKIKLNSIVDNRMIELLYAASQAGVTIRMIIRGICSLIPGVPGLSDNIEVISIVDKYLEHSRIFIFCNDGDEQIFISSADWMIRNLDNRVEVATPIYDPDIKRELRDFFEIQYKDNTKARIIDSKQDNQYRGLQPGRKKYRAQDDVDDYLRKGLNATEESESQTVRDQE